MKGIAVDGVLGIEDFLQRQLAKLGDRVAAAEDYAALLEARSTTSGATEAKLTQSLTQAIVPTPDGTPVGSALERADAVSALASQARTAPAGEGAYVLQLQDAGVRADQVFLNLAVEALRSAHQSAFVMERGLRPLTEGVDDVRVAIAGVLQMPADEREVLLEAVRRAMPLPPEEREMAMGAVKSALEDRLATDLPVLIARPAGTLAPTGAEDLVRHQTMATALTPEQQQALIAGRYGNEREVLAEVRARNAKEARRLLRRYREDEPEPPPEPPERPEPRDEDASSEARRGDPTLDEKHPMDADLALFSGHAASITGLRIVHDLWQDGWPGMTLLVSFQVKGLRGAPGSVRCLLQRPGRTASPSGYARPDAAVTVDRIFIPGLDDDTFADFPVFVPYKDLAGSVGLKPLEITAAIWSGPPGDDRATPLAQAALRGGAFSTG